MEYLNDVDKKDLLKDYVMNTNDFNGQKILYEERALINMFLNLVFMEKGTVQKLPDMGYDINKRKHKLQKRSELNKMEKDLREQISEYLPGTFTDIKFKFDNRKGDVTIEAKTSSDRNIKFSFNENIMLDSIHISIPDKDFQ